jgi:hypothetical protein
MEPVAAESDKRDVVVLLPGFGQDAGQTVAHVADIVARELDHNAGSGVSAIRGGQPRGTDGRAADFAAHGRAPGHQVGLVALETFFPATSPPKARHGRVSRLVTIGCPFDLTRLSWQKYFTTRHAACSRLEWLNVYSPVDVLASNFRDDGADAAAERGIEFRDRAPAAVPGHNVQYEPGMSLTITGLLTLTGLRVHQNYWGDDVYAPNCFGLVVRTLYAEDVRAWTEAPNNPTGTG